MTKRICYIHVGPHKTGTSAIQWFLQENRAELLEHGYFVPESETKRGAHHALAEKLAGMEVGEHREPLVGGGSWAEIFAADTAEEFTPNDFEMCRPNWFTARRLRRAIREIKQIVHEVLLDRTLAVDAPWNDVARRSGLVSKE